MGHFIRRNAPTVNQRQLQDQVNSLHDRVLRVERQLQTLMRPHSHTAVPDRGGEVGVQVRKDRAGFFSVAKAGIGNGTGRTVPIIDRSLLQVCMALATHSGRTSNRPRQRRWLLIAT